MIAFDAESNGASAGAQTSLTISHTVTGSNTAIVVMASNDGGTTTTISGVTYNGDALSAVDNLGNTGSNSNTSTWILAGADTGTHDIVISSSASRQLYGIGLSYTGAKQTGQPDAHNTATDSASPYSISTTTVADNSWIVIFARGGTTLVAGTNVTSRSAPFDTIKGGDTNAAITPAGGTSQTWTDSGANAETALLTVSIAPVAVAVTKKNLTILGVS